MCSFLILPLVCYNNLTEKQKKIIFHKLNLRGPDKTNIFDFGRNEEIIASTAEVPEPVVSKEVYILLSALTALCSSF